MNGKIFSILSVVPQNGSTYLATNLGYFMNKLNRKENKKVLLLDFDFNYSSLGSHFIEDDVSSLDDLILQKDAISSELFKKSITPTTLGFDILKGSTLNRIDLFTENFILNILNLSIRIYDYIFIVTNPNIKNPAIVLTLLNSDKIILVTKNNYINKLKSKETLQLIEDLKKTKTDVIIVYNFNNNKHKITAINELIPNSGILTLLEYVPSSIDNINLMYKNVFLRNSPNDTKFKLICKELLKNNERSE